MKLLSHPNLVKLLAVCTTGEPVHIVMELMIHGNTFTTFCSTFVQFWSLLLTSVNMILIVFLGDLKNFLLARRRMVNQPGAPEVTIILIIQGCMAEFLSRLTLHKYLFQSPKMSLRKS